MINDKPLTLIIGANGKTGSRVAAILQKHHYPVRLAGRTKPSLSVLPIIMSILIG